MYKQMASSISVPDYLEKWTWAERLAHALGLTSDWFDGRFAQANAAYVQELAGATADIARLHVVFNIGADALREFMVTDDYKNVYEHPVAEGKELSPSKKRRHVDRTVGLDDPKNFYFCALSVGGTGMRFYGEYCVVLKSPDDAKSVKRVLDRNSYDFVTPPLSSIFESLSEPGKILSLSFWRDEDAVRNWRNLDAHRVIQAAGRHHIFDDYRLRVAEVSRDYGKLDRAGAPDDSRCRHGG